MKTDSYVLRSSALICIFMILALGACTTAPSLYQNECDPDAPFPAPWCRTTADAGTDAESDAGTDAPPNQDAIDNPGLDTSYWLPDTCKTGHCVPAPVGDDVGAWEKEPISLWIGPVDQVPAACPADPVSGVPNEIYRLYDQLVAPPAQCSSCSCASSEGTCTGVPATLELRAGMCAQSGVATVPFDSPANWDGSCTNADMIAAGATCPAGSQTLCTQSVHSSALPSPVNDACKASVSAPSSALETSWGIGGLACYGNTQNQTCGSNTLSAYCVNDPGPAWLQCTYRVGVHEKCPDNYQYARHVLYPKEPIDDRGCSACECGAPMGSACEGGLRLSAGGTCGTDFVTLQVGSMGPMCYDFLVPGKAIGSKAIVNRTYQPGVCAASGGESIGSAIPNDSENGGVVTFCCRAPEPPPPR